ncbi:hypothetical protein SedNR2807_03640 [Citrobacter sedlakii]
MHMNIAWQDVDTVLLDMDGTLLDLAFNTFFWQKLVPETYGAQRGSRRRKRRPISVRSTMRFSIR